ncbi:hypothetical protein ACWCP8_31745, partial [Streptomyces sp. NPDC002206]
VLAGAAINLFPSDGDAPELPLPLGTRLYVLAPLLHTYRYRFPCPVSGRPPWSRRWWPSRSRGPCGGR